MFEYWFLGGENPRTGTTHDFLEVLCQIAKYFDTEVAGSFVQKLLDDQRDSLDYLRVVEWNFEDEWVDVKAGPDPWPKYSIRLVKHI